MEIFWRDAERWLRQAEYDLRAAVWSEEGGHFAVACFLAQQAAAKSLRAFLFLNKEDFRETRSVADLLDRAITYEEGFRDFVGKTTSLDLYYKTARFPDAVPGGIPAELISVKDSKEAIRQASDMLALVERRRKAFMPESL
jgi:HEPN domain-containing protein